MKLMKAAAASSMAAFIAANAIALAQHTPGERDRQQPPRPGTTDTKSPSQARAGSVQFLRCSNVMDLNVQSTTGENIGEIDELACDVQHNQIAFVILSTGGALGVGGDKYAVPFKAFNFDPKQEKVTLNFDRNRLQGAPKFDGDFNQLSNKQKLQDICQYYGQRPYWEGLDTERPGTSGMPGRDKPPGTTPPGHTGTPPGHSGANPDRTTTPPSHGGASAHAGAQIQLAKASDLIGTNVQSPQDENLCEIDDIMIANNNGRLAYMVLGCGGFLGLGEDLIAVPWQAADINAQRDDVKIVLNIEKERLEQAPKFNKNQWPDMSSEVWAREVHAFYGTDSGWIYGYGETDVGDRGQDRDRDRGQDRDRLDQPGRPGGQFGGTVGGQAGAWTMNDEYMRLFNAGRLETIQCRVTNVSTFNPGPGKAEGVLLLCTRTGGQTGGQTNDQSMGGRGGETGGQTGGMGGQSGAQAQGGQTVRVHLGPQWYIQHQPRQFRPGDNITVEGSRVTFQGEEVCIAKEIQVDGQTMVLRQDNGHPMWLAWQGQGNVQPGSNTPPTPGRSPTTPQRPGAPGSGGTDRP